MIILKLEKFKSFRIQVFLNDICLAPFLGQKEMEKERKKRSGKVSSKEVEREKKVNSVIEYK